MRGQEKAKAGHENFPSHDLNLRPNGQENLGETPDLFFGCLPLVVPLFVPSSPKFRSAVPTDVFHSFSVTVEWQGTSCEQTYEANDGSAGGDPEATNASCRPRKRGVLLGSNLWA